MPKLQIRDCPADLLGRVNGIAELAEVDRDELVIYWLRLATKETELLQDQLRRKYQAVVKKKKSD